MHRDLKMQNILNNKGILKLADFGMAKKNIDEDSLTASLYGGTLSHEAPEILLRMPYNYKIDIWSLGVMLFTMLFR